ncbi:attractin-like protein 1 [Onthophagus taurus]|uniref:attractin-like protein 1 n=1 Tax=Onthophagus taurus TaxID=166361 RepID=UPI000C20B054|nr:attractin-like protein 1 [Onthophagus taurus]
MLESLQMFLFLFKSKYRRKCPDASAVVFCSFVLVLGAACSLVAAKCQDNGDCGPHGKCVNDTCVCSEGWQGSNCQFCAGKIRLASPTGTIHDGLGNYSIGLKCSWLIDAPNSTITFHLEEFATECGWDHLYIFDGDSVESPLLAVFSGLMYRHDYSIRKVPEVVATSGSALVHFFSDDAYNMSGFNMTYRLNACPSKVSGMVCSGNGICIDKVCTCDGKWGGSACHIEKCPNSCNSHLGRGYCEHMGCVCNNGYKGDDCGQLADNGYWEAIQPSGFVPPGSASHGAAVWRDSLYIIAGQRYDINSTSIIYTYDFNGNVWETHHYNEGPSLRYAHSTVLYGDKIFIYGGVVGNRGPTAELWAFDINAKAWENVTVKSGPCNASYLLCGPLELSGHTATIVTNSNKKSDRMIVIFGYSPRYGYLNNVQEYYFGTREWHNVNTDGYPVKGGYGHTATYDSYSMMIYVYGGYISSENQNSMLSKALYSYEPISRIWRLLNEGPSVRFLHTATFISPGLMLIFGGNTHNDTAHSFRAKCYSSELLAYEVACDSWHTLSIPIELSADLSRYGHSAVIFENSLYIYGGFDGQMLSDILKYTAGNCSALKNQTACLSQKPGVSCAWDNSNSKCIPINDRSIKWYELQDARTEPGCTMCKCPISSRTDITQSILNKKQKCNGIQDCTSCVQTSYDCVWCNGNCTHSTDCKESLLGIVEMKSCLPDPAPLCNQLHTCTSCGLNSFCNWEFEGKVRCGNAQVPSERTTCAKVCSEYTSCLNCTEEECIWCQNEGRCIDKNAYISSYPYGQCREWTTKTTTCRSGGKEEKSQCSSYLTCGQCRDEPACGWCDDGSKTGLGKCMPGGYAGPTLHTQSLPSNTCPSDRWHFTTCPLCQCNGHASCRGNTSVCQSCSDLTTGPHCEKCVPGYWGSPVNGGKCQPCECNGHATQCHSDTGKCFCTTKGLIGDHCEKCDQANHYTGDPSNKGSCFYALAIDYQFTFNLSKKEDRHYTQINFQNSPNKPDIDAEFMIACSVMAKMNVTVRKANSKEEKAIYTAHNCTNNFKTRFLKSEYNFGEENNVSLTTFYVYVYDFQSPLWIQISFSQYLKLNIQQFFITFSSCFLALLLVAAFLWKIKQRYDMYRRRQRLFVEMEQMASRPFSQVLVELEGKERIDENTISTVTDSKKKKRDSPSPIALEPCNGNRAAVLSLLVRLPTGGEPYVVKGQSAGLAIASALVTLGNPRRVSIDQVKTDTKCLKGRKAQSQHPDSCL